MNAIKTWDVIIVGAGPAGSTTAALLAKQGVSTLVVEREEFPRFHIGESLLPSGLNIHEMIGLAPSEQVFRYKRGAQFVCERTNRIAAFDFSRALPGGPRHAWHVERSKFDTMVRDRALHYGAEVRHGVTVNDIGTDEGSAWVNTSHGREIARFVVDATGQDRFLAKRQDSIQPYRQFGKAAVFCHFDGISDAVQQEIGPGNDIRIMMVDEGWAWIIPLAGTRISVGLVTRKRGVGVDWLKAYVESSPLLKRWTEGATMTEPRIISNFSYRNAIPHGHRFACVGDSACFLDPVFSSGVSIAMNGAAGLAERLAPALESGSEGDPAMMESFWNQMDVGYDTFASLIYRFYNTRFVDNMFFGAAEDGGMKAAITSVLAGDVWNDGNPFREMLLRSRMQNWRSEADSAEAES